MRQIVFILLFTVIYNSGKASLICNDTSGSKRVAKLVQYLKKNCKLSGSVARKLKKCLIAHRTEIKSCRDPRQIPCAEAPYNLKKRIIEQFGEKVWSEYRKFNQCYLGTRVQKVLIQRKTSPATGEVFGFPLAGN
ncbi:MAG TPA: hypothetical protein VF476_13105 [Chitinophagaceae bacterium]